MKLKLRQLFKWFAAFWQWLAEGRIPIMCVLVLAAAGIWVFNTWFSETTIFWTGIVLQLCGMVFAINGLLRIRTHFRQVPLKKLFVKWLKHFPKWNRARVVGATGVSMSAAVGKAHVSIWINDDPTQPIEERITGIVSNLERIRATQDSHTIRIDNLGDSHEAHKKHVAVESEKMKREIHSDLEALHTSDLSTSIVGLVWITAGITMSAMASELTKWVL